MRLKKHHENSFDFYRYHFLIAMVVFLYLLIAGADKNRWHDRGKDD